MEKSNVETVVIEDNSHLKGYIKGIIIGAIIGIVVVCVIICCIYLFNGRIKSANEISMFKVPLYGIKRDRVLKHNLKLDKLLMRLLDSSSGLTLSDEYVSESIVLQGFDNLFVYNGTSLLEGEGKCDAKLWENIPNVILSDKSCANSKDALVKAKEIGNEIIIVELNKSKTKDVIAEVETARIQKINVAGIVCV